MVCASALDADCTDGLLDIVDRRANVSEPGWCGSQPKLYSGAHVHHPLVTSYRARTVEIDAEGITAYADGERACAAAGDGHRRSRSATSPRLAASVPGGRRVGRTGPVTAPLTARAGCRVGWPATPARRPASTAAAASAAGTCPPENH